MYFLGTINYPDEPLCPGKYLGPVIDVGPARTAKILQHNGEVVYQSMYWSLTIEERADNTIEQDMANFRKTAEACLGAKLTHAELEEFGIPDTLEYIPYSGEDQNKKTFPDLDEEITPEVGNDYMHALVMLLCGNQLMHGTVKVHKRDLDGNPIGCQLDNPILGTWLYDIEFPDGEVAPLTANAIAQAMYAQCDVDRNEYLLLECFVDIKKTTL